MTLKGQARTNCWEYMRHRRGATKKQARTVEGGAAAA
jgi:hypothetical protein